jgi:plastocyanin
MVAALAAVAVPLPLHAVHRSHHAATSKKPSSPPQAKVVSDAPKPPPRHLRANLRTVHHAKAARTIHLAGDPGVTIADFSFSPSSLTIQVGDTVTWSNNGPSQHTATADNGSFDTGTLSKGQSASHTFNQAGTFTYICTIHPFMKGTIVVQGSGSSGGGGGGSSSGGSGSGSSSSGSGSSNSGASSGSSGASGSSSGGHGSLPMTGFDLLGALLCGTALLAAGLGLRRYLAS